MKRTSGSQLAASILLLGIGCADVDYATGSGQGGGAGVAQSASATGASTPSSGAGGEGGMVPNANATVTGGGGRDCYAACGVLYDCGVENMNCPNFTGDASERAAFVNQCVPLCESSPALAGLVEPTDCTATIAAVTGASPEFAAACQSPASTSAGAGGSIGAGGGVQP